LSLKTVGTRVITTIRFKKANPIKWEEFQEHLKSLEIEQFGQGEAATADGRKLPALAALHKDGQILYIPESQEVMSLGQELEPSLRLFREVLRIITEIVGSQEKLKGKVAWYELQFQAEVEPDLATPMEIMTYITPPGLYDPFEKVLQVGKLTMFQYRFVFTPSEFEGTIRQTVPWYDVQFFPEIENPDRFIVHVICRDTISETAIKRCEILTQDTLRFIEEKEREAA